MKKYFVLFALLFSFLLGGCTIDYSLNVDIPSVPDNPTDDPTNDPEEGNGNDNDQEQTTPPILPNQPDIIEPITIDQNSYFFPSTLTQTNYLIDEYSYIDNSKTHNYKVYSAYYSEYYDTLYIAYDTINNPTQTLKAADLYHIERHALNYFTTDNNKTDYKDYLKAVLIYPDTLASSCRKNLTDSQSISINGCANYVGKDAVISLNRMASISDFYEERRVNASGNTYYLIEPMRYTFAHEFGHISTYYHMAYKNDEDYEDYLKLRLGSYYNTIYPSGLPAFYSSQNNGYYTQPVEILADDYVELFYDTSTRAKEDVYEYDLNNEYTRNSLKVYPSIQNLKDNTILYDNLKNYYKDNFLNYNNKIKYQKPIVVSTNLPYINYYESYTKIGDINNLKRITSNIDINLIAIGEVSLNGKKYYRVILSSTFKTTGGAYDEKEAGKKIGYIDASYYSVNTNLKIYSINYNRSNNSMLEKNNMVPINNYNDIYIIPYYEFSYVISLNGDINTATAYDYLNTSIANQTFTVSIYSFGTLVA